MFNPTTPALAGLLMLAACGSEPAESKNANPSDQAPPNAAVQRELTLTYFNMEG